MMNNEVSASSTELSFWSLLNQLKQGRLVDLTHSFDKDSPHFPTSIPLQVETVASYEEAGFFVQRFHFEGQWGTHVDAPVHFFENLRTVEQIPLEEMILPLVVIDIEEKVQANPDYVLNVEDIISWEDQYQPIPENSFVALRTGWSKRWPNQKAMLNLDNDGNNRTPGWSLGALQYLYEECMITATGHETIDPDPGLLGKASKWECERYILQNNHYQIELLTNLNHCPPAGAIVICAFPKAKGASGFPARVFAICPK